MNDKELFENLCFSPAWQDTEAVHPAVRHSKDMATLLSELEEIKDNLQEIEEHKWHLANLMRFHQEGFSNK